MRLADEVVHWCVYSFEWSATLSVSQRRWYDRQSLGDTAFPPHEPMPTFMKTGELHVGTMPVAILRARGHGLPREDETFMGYIVSNVSRILKVDVKAVEGQSNDGHVSYSIGHSTSYAFDASHLCGACSVTRRVSGLRYKVDA